MRTAVKRFTTKPASYADPLKQRTAWMQQIDLRYDNFVTEMERHIEGCMRAVAEEWQSRFPKREVKFCDVMGLSGWYIDDEALHHSSKWYRIYIETDLFDSLATAENWYNDISRRCDNLTLEFTLPPRRRRGRGRMVSSSKGGSE